MAKPELGIKRQCLHCGAKFYDLNKDPAVCPRCETVFQATSGLTRVAPPAVARREAEDAEVEPAGPEMVSLDDVEAAESGKDAGGEDDVDVGEDAADSFLEEEEEGEDDVVGLIDGDIEEDEES